MLAAPLLQGRARVPFMLPLGPEGVHCLRALQRAPQPLSFYLARKPNQLADFANLFFKGLLRQFAAEFRFHFVGSFKL